MRGVNSPPGPLRSPVARGAERSEVLRKSGQPAVVPLRPAARGCLSAGRGPYHGAVPELTPPARCRRRQGGALSGDRFMALTSPARPGHSDPRDARRQVLPSSERAPPGAGFRVSGRPLIYLAYLDEFGHVGPYVSRTHPRHNDSPVFGFAGFVMPAEEVRGFGTWFYQRKCELLDFEIRRSVKHPASWEKKGAFLYRAANRTRYRQLHRTTNRLLGRIERPAATSCTLASGRGRSRTSTTRTRCTRRCWHGEPAARHVLRRAPRQSLAVPEGSSTMHPRLEEILTAAARDMYGPFGAEHAADRAALPSGEPPRFRPVQSADWFAETRWDVWAPAGQEPSAWPENADFRRYIESSADAHPDRSGIRD